MMRRVACVVLAAAALAVARGAVAGQVFVNVAPGSNIFSPSTVATLNTGDHVIWHWAAGGHTVTSGNPNTGTKSGLFDSNVSGGTQALGTVFSWKTSGTSPVSYFCQPHHPGMQGSIVFPIGATIEADFRITEVRFDGVSLNFVEIANLGDDVGDLAGFRLVINGTATTLTSQILNPGERVTFPNPSGLGTSGSVALYAPETIASGSNPGPSLTDATMMIDYVEWGTAGNQPLESTAVSTTNPVLWTVGQFAPQAAGGHSIVFCGLRFQHGAGFWNETRFPTPAAVNDCVNPTLPSTWGRIKTLYR